MGLLDPSKREIKLLTGLFTEAAKFQGTSITVQLISGAERDLYKDPNYTYHNAKKIDVILNERPNRYVLDSYGWYNEDEEFVPMIMHVAKHGPQGEILKPLTGTIVILPYELAEDEIHERVYLVSNSVLTNPGSWMWVCKIVPYRHPKDNSTPDFEIDNNYEFLNVPK